MLAFSFKLAVSHLVEVAANRTVWISKDVETVDNLVGGGEGCSWHAGLGSVLIYKKRSILLEADVT